MPDIQGLLFDKDGTLFDFQGTWGGWAADLVQELAEGDAALAEDLAARIGLDRAGRQFHSDSFVIAGTAEEATEALLAGVPHIGFEPLLSRLIETSKELVPVEAAPLAPLMARFSEAGLVLGVATNDAEEAAIAQLAGIGMLEVFQLVIGADTGHGAKPAPGQCLAFAEAVGLAPAKVAMIGDSTHDLNAGRAAGMVTIGVLSGPASRADLQPFADVVLQDIGELPGWLGLE